jgi:hypothetical protein
MSDRAAFLHLPAPEEQRIAVLYAWIATHADGTEGIIGGWFDGQPVPLVSAFRKTADQMGAMAEQARVLGEQATGRTITKLLVRFVRAEEVT